MPVAAVVAGNKITAAWGNTVAAFAALFNESSTSWVSPFAGGVTVGNGTTGATYTRAGPMVFCRLSFVFGSSSAISGAVTLSLPVTGIVNSLHGTTVLEDTGVYYDGAVFNLATTTAQLRVKNASVTYTRNDVLSSTIPFTWGTGDSITCNFAYLT